MFLIIVLGVALMILVTMDIIELPIYVPIGIIGVGVLWDPISSILGSIGANRLDQTDSSGQTLNSCGCTGLVTLRDRGAWPRWARDRSSTMTCGRAQQFASDNPGRYLVDGCA